MPGTTSNADIDAFLKERDAHTKEEANADKHGKEIDLNADDMVYINYNHTDNTQSWGGLATSYVPQVCWTISNCEEDQPSRISGAASFRCKNT